MNRMMRYLKLMMMLAMVNSLAPAVWAAGNAAYRRIAQVIACYCEDNAIQKVAVLPFKAVDSVDRPGREAVAERISTQLVSHKKVRVVERNLLEKVLQEQELGASGVVDQAQAMEIGQVMGVEAVVSGSILRKSDDIVEVNVRLIHAKSAEVLAAASEDVERDWAGQDRTGFRDAPSDAAVPPPTFDLNFKPWWEAKPALAQDFFASDCDDYDRVVDELQRATLERKALYWADKLQTPGFSIHSLTRNPGSEIRNLQLRSEFYRRLKELCGAGVRRPPTESEMRSVARAEKRVLDLTRRCR